MTRRIGLLDAVLASSLLALLVAALALIGAPERASGSARVIDGDTLEVAGRRLRLAGLDAPELSQLCGREGALTRCGEGARDALRRLVDGEVLSCRLRGTDRYGRGLARCEAGGQDLGRSLVRAGQAVAYGAYEAEEREARAAGRGIWSAPFTRPGEWRRRHEAERSTVRP